MTPVLFAIIIAVLICAYFYARVVVKERTAHLESERDAEIRHAADWKDLATHLTQRGLLFRELPLLNEDIEAISRPPRETFEGDEDETLAELEARQAEYDDPLKFSSEGELGARRELARKIALKRKDSDLKDKSELSTEHVENVFTAEDEQHLRSN